MHLKKSTGLIGTLVFMSFITAASTGGVPSIHPAMGPTEPTEDTFKSSDYPDCIGSSGVCEEFLDNTDGAWETDQ